MIRRARLLRRKRPGALTVRLEAEVGSEHSFGQAARELALPLALRPEIDLRVVCRGRWEFPPEKNAKTRALVKFLDRDPEAPVDVHIRHHWPPCFDPPASGRWVLAQPWEYGSLPVQWVETFHPQVDDFWCFTHFVKDAFLRAGFEDDRTPVLPHGVDPDVFREGLEPYPLPTEKRFRFLFVGGTIHRKGADLLLKAYLKTFSRFDDVALVVKDMGTRTFYLNQTMGEDFSAAGRDPTRPEIVYLNEHLAEEDLARLYSSCQVLVAPYRGEGFALPVLEAMACAAHVIVTAGGATDDFVDGSCGTRIASDKRYSSAELGDGTRCVDRMWFLEADIEELSRAMRWAYEHPEQSRELGHRASQRARREWTWDRAAELAAKRLLEISERPARREFQSKISPPVTEGEKKKESIEPLESTTVDPKSLRALELDLMREEVPVATQEALRQLASLRPLSEDAFPVLRLAEKVLTAEGAFAPRGLIEEVKLELLALVRAALPRKPEEQRLPRTRKARVSLTMIVRDEEENLEACVSPLRALVDEIVIVDTGSKDHTREIARSLGAKVFEFEWVDSFARARNEAIDRATGDWIFWMDADDRIDPSNAGRLAEVFDRLELCRIAAYAMKVECVARPGGSPTVVDHVRLFPRHPQIRWEYRVHENILPSINRLQGTVEWADVTIRHVGYLDDSLRDKKRRRDHALLLKNFEELPEDPFLHFNLGHSFMEGDDLDRAAYHLRESIARSEPHYSQVKKAYTLLAQVEFNRSGSKAALSVLDEAAKHYPEHPEILYFHGVYLHDEGDLQGAARALERVLSLPRRQNEFNSFDIGILGYKSEQRLARVYLDMNRHDEASLLLEKIRREEPEYLPAVLDQAHLFITRGRGEEAQGLIELLRSKGFRSDALYLEGLLADRTGRLSEARSFYERSLSLEPRSEETLRELAHVELKLGDRDAAEKHLLAHAALNPKSAAAHHNLAGVRLSRGDVSGAKEAVESSLRLRPRSSSTLELKAQIDSLIEKSYTTEHSGRET